jgi:hypothetical protein
LPKGVRTSYLNRQLLTLADYEWESPIRSTSIPTARSMRLHLLSSDPGFAGLDDGPRTVSQRLGKSAKRGCEWFCSRF